MGSYSNYEQYEVTDFILDDQFVNWVKKPTTGSDHFWHQWLTNHPDRAEIIREARFWILQISVRENLPTDSAVQDAIQSVHSQLHDVQPKLLPLGRRSWAWQVAASVAFILLAVGGWYSWQRQSLASKTQEPVTVTHETNGMVSQENQTNRASSITLPDGSRVRLSPQSKLIYPKAFAVSLREVRLTGEAFFQVVRRTQQPFVVNTGQINVRVLGTSFTVKAFDNTQTIQVAVTSGKVAVSKAVPDSQKGGAGVLLTPNQQVTFSLRDDVFRKSLVEKPLIVSKQSQEADFEFDEERVTNVFQQLEAAYGIELVYSPEKLRNCTLTAHLANEPMYQKLNMICQAIGATHETVGTQIIIHSEGCE